MSTTYPFPATATLIDVTWSVHLVAGTILLTLRNSIVALFISFPAQWAVPAPLEDVSFSNRGIGGCRRSGCDADEKGTKGESGKMHVMGFWGNEM